MPDNLEQAKVPGSGNRGDVLHPSCSGGNCSDVERVQGFPSKDLGNVGACPVEEPVARCGMDGEKHRRLEGQKLRTVQRLSQFGEVSWPVLRSQPVRQVLSGDDCTANEVVGFFLVFFGVPGDDCRCFGKVVAGYRGDSAPSEWCGNQQIR